MALTDSSLIPNGLLPLLEQLLERLDRAWSRDPAQISLAELTALENEYLTLLERRASTLLGRPCPVELREVLAQALRSA